MYRITFSLFYFIFCLVILFFKCFSIVAVVRLKWFFVHNLDGKKCATQKPTTRAIQQLFCWVLKIRQKQTFEFAVVFFYFFFQLVVSSFQYFNHIIADSIYLSMCVSIVHLLFILVHLFHFFFILFRLIIYYYYGWNKSVIVYRKTVYQITQDDTRHSLHWKHVIERVCLPNEENGKLWHGWFHHYAYSYIWK